MDVLLTLIATLLVAFLVGIEQGYYGGIFLPLDIPIESVAGVVLVATGLIRGGGPGRYLEAIGFACLVIFVSTVARGLGWTWKHPEHVEGQEPRDEADS